MIRSLIAAAIALLAASPAYAADTCATPADVKVATSTDKAALNKGVACRTARIKGRESTIVGLQTANKVDADQVAARVARLEQLAKPTPPPASAPAAPKLAGLVVEGDSLTGPEWGGNYPGIYRKLRPGVQMTVLAKGGARINDASSGNGLIQRLPALIAAKPAAVTVLIGANDLGDGQYATPEAWLAALWGYVGSVKATGAKVAVGTVLPICFSSNASYTARHLQRRAVVNAAIRAAVGSKIDAVIDYAADDKIGPDAAACSRTWFKDEIHTSDGDAAGNGGEGRMALLFAPVADKLLAGATAVTAPSTGQGDATQPIPGGTVAVGLPSIASNFSTAGLLEPAYQTGVLGAIPPSGAPDVVGAFRFICTAGQIAKDDPIVFPGQPGQSHLHQFFGNTLANAFSTFNTLRTNGDSTCTNRLNRSAYWIPAMLNGKGGVVRPDFVSIYYKRRPAADPECQRMGKACVALPRGLRFVFGYDMVTGKAPTGHGYFNCQGNGAQEGHYADIVEAASHCQLGSQLGLIINAPNCWNGKDLDSPNHRDHVAYSGWYTPDGVERCPADYPYVIPTFTLGAWYTVDADLDRSGTWDAKRPTWSLSSDDMSAMGHGIMRPGSTLHADWWGAWDDPTMETWTANCIDKLLNCNGGNLGNGWQMKHEGPPLTYKAEPRVVPVPTI